MVYSDEERGYIRSLYERTKNRPSDAARLFHEEKGSVISTSSIRKIWCDAGFEKNPHGGRRNGISESEFRELYQRYKGDVGSIAQELGYNPKTIVKKCNDFGLNYHNAPRLRNSTERNSKRDFLDDPRITAPKPPIWGGNRY